MTDEQLESLPQKVNKNDSKVIQLLLKPQLIVALITAVVGPWTVVKVSEGIEETKIKSAQLMKKQELQNNILTKIMEYASKEQGDVTSSLRKISLLTDLVNDNKETFGLTFPSIEKQIKSERRIEKENLEKQLSDKESSLSVQKVELNSKESDLKIRKEELKIAKVELKELNAKILKLEDNKNENNELSKKLEGEKDAKETLIATIATLETET